MPARDATLTIRTAPPLPGIRLSLDDTTVTTDESGIATVTEQRSTGTHALTLLDTRIETPGKRYEFSRWVGQRDPDQAYTPTRRHADAGRFNDHRHLLRAVRGDRAVRRPERAFRWTPLWSHRPPSAAIPAR